MKKRIVALILTVVMSLLALTSCGSFDFAEEDLSDYASFNYAEFVKALGEIEIEDGDFTTNEETRAQKVAAKIYNAVADKIVAATYESDYVKSGELGAGDVLYFTYYAVDEKTGNVYFTSEMKESAITASSTKANHVIKLGDVDEDNKFLTLIKENLAKVDIADYVYSMLVAADLKDDELKVKEGDVIVISYTRTHTETNAEGVTTEVKESAVYETVDLSSNHILASYILAEGSVAKVGSTLAVFDKKDDAGKDVTKTTFDVDVKDENGETVTYTYSNVKIEWKVESEGQAIASFKHTPYDKDQNVTPDNLRATSAAKVNLKDVELTYYVYPVYAISAPAAEEVTAADILNYVYGSSLKESSFEVLADETYVNGSEKLKDLLEDVANIFDTKSEDNEVYKEGEELKTLLDAYNKAVEDGGSKPSTEQQEAIDSTKEALTKAQNKALADVVAKIVAATNGTKTVGEVVLEEYEENTYHSLKEAYDTDITEKVHTAVWELIDKSVTIKDYPADLREEYIDHLYESYEYDFYKGDYSSTVTNYDKYGTLDAYLIATLKISSIDGLDAALKKEAESQLAPIIKIYVVAKACEADAVKALPGYVEADIKGGAYYIDEESYRELYGDKADEKIAEAKENAEENIKTAREDADLFLVDDEYMKGYKKEIGRAYYRSLIEEYGEINLRAAFQFNRLFYYLTSTNIELNEEEGHTEIKYVDGYLDFRTVTYKLVEADADTEDK